MKSRYLIFKLATVFLIIVTLVGCEKDGFENHAASDGIRIYTSSTMTRTTFQDDNAIIRVKWNEGDGISIFSGKQKNLSYRALKTQGGITEFCPVAESLSITEGDTVYAIYPENFDYDSSLPDGVVEIPFQEGEGLDKNNAYADALYAMGKVENGTVNLQFKHLFTFVKIIIPKNLVKNSSGIQLSSSAAVCYHPTILDIKNGQIMEGNMNNSMGGNIAHAESDEANFYLYYAILPQPENAILSLRTYGDPDIFLFSRSTPIGGMKAGYMYIMDMNSDKIQLEKQLERKVLIDLFQSTNGNTWKNHTNWGSNCPLTDWYGVSGISNMVILDLLDNNLEGTLPESLVTLLDNAELIEMRNNNLYGKVPEKIRKHPRWNELGWTIVLDQKPFYGFDPCANPEGYTNESPRGGFDFSTGNTNLFLHDMEITLIDGSQDRLMNIIKKNKLTQILSHNRGFFDSPWNISDHRINLHLDYQSHGLGTIVEIGYYWNEPIGKEWKEFSSQLPTCNFFFIDGKPNQGIIPLDKSGLKSNGGDIFLVNSQGELVDHLKYDGAAITAEKLEKWYCHKIDSVIRIYCGEPEEHPVYSRQYYTSTDYSRDGEVLTLQKASVGKGIDLVFLGEAFVDKHMNNGGLYEQKMKEAIEQFFSYEPYKSFRNRFNIYVVKVVSPNAEFTAGAKHRINESDATCIEYMQNITGLNPNQPPMISVIYNITTEGTVGRSYTNIYNDGTFVGYMMEGVNDVLNHESGGHGFAKLLDEYTEPGNEGLTLPKDGQEALDYQWLEFGWGANVDWRNDRNTVKWAHLLNDSRYANEGLGLYEGAFLYGYGAYRPTENSMMRYNDTPFNAPSREQIYKSIMQQSEGESWTYNYEDFVKYDAINRNNAITRSLRTTPSEKVRDEWKKRHRPPVFVNGTWRDAINKKQTKNSIIVPLR